MARRRRIDGAVRLSLEIFLAAEAPRRNKGPSFGLRNEKFADEVSPRRGRKIVAHGVSRGSAYTPSPPSLLPPARERGAEGGVRASAPGLAPWATIFRPWRGW